MDWGTLDDTRHSICGYVFTFDGSAVSWDARNTVRKGSLTLSRLWSQMWLQSQTLSSEGVRESEFSQSLGPTYIQEGRSCTGRIEIKGTPTMQGATGAMIGALTGAALYGPCLGCLGRVYHAV